MPRKPRLFVPGATYHVYCRVARGEFVFDDPYEAEEFVKLFEQFSGHSIDDLSSPLRKPELIRGRIELAILAVGRFGLRSSEVADLLNKHPSSLTRWLNLGTVLNRRDLAFRIRIDRINQRISAAALDNASMRSVAP
jgi:hypothetical protein